MDNLKEKFLSVYANIPETLRKEIIIMINNKTYTWDSAYFEITDDGKLSTKMLNTLSDIGMI